jgi:hypothetical protein
MGVPEAPMTDARIFFIPVRASAPLFAVSSPAETR